MSLFLIDQDYEVFAQQDVLDDVVRNNRSRLRAAELAAQAEITGYLNVRYDVAKIFPLILEWNASITFAVDSYTYREGVFYRCVAAHQDRVPATNLYQDASTGFWVIEDPRNPMIVRYMCVISLYLCYQALHGYQIPEHRVQEYDLARKWLKMAASGEIDPLLPKPESTDDSRDIVAGGGLTRKDYEY